VIVAAVVLWCVPSYAQDPRLAGNTDLSKVQPPDGLAPLGGAILTGYHFWPTQTTRVLLGPLDNGAAVGGKQKAIVGARNLLFYSQPDAPDQVAILRNYEAGIQNAGGGIAFQCDGASCAVPGDSVGGACGQAITWFYKGPKDPINDVIQSAAGANIGNWGTLVSNYEGKFMQGLPTECHLIVGLIPAIAGRGDRYVSVLTVNLPTFSPPLVDTLVEIAESNSFDVKTVTVDADAMANGIRSSGHIALYGIYFDFDKSVPKPESGEALAQIAKLLRTDPGLRVLVVGHTDNHGGYDYNMTLSDRRAQAIVAALEQQYRIDGARLRAAGDGMTAPVASNDTEAGRALNRRVELVKQ
jgi:outer membrane protein OmpA-like peptidoglycan-associated protein